MSNKKASLSKYIHRYTPRHPLAKHAVRQIAKQELRAQDIVQAMGYGQNHTLTACDRLRHVLSSEILGLNDTDINTDIDGYFSDREFVRSLLLVLNIDYQSFADDIAQIEYDLAHYPYPLPKYHLRADIDFTWSSGANWMSRGVASSKARVYLPKDMAKMTDLVRDAIIEKYIAAHYKTYKGNLPYDGVIRGYRLAIKQGDEIVMRAAYGLPKV